MSIGSATYWQAVQRIRNTPPPPPEPYPAPAVTSRDPVPAGVTPPRPVLDLVKRAEDAGWAARWQYSRGCQPHGTTGRPTAEREWFGVQCLHPESGARVVAVYGGASWDSVFLITRTQLTTRGSVTDAREFLDLAGRVLDLRAWVAGKIAHRAEVAAARPKRESAGKGKAMKDGAR